MEIAIVTLTLLTVLGLFMPVIVSFVLFGWAIVLVVHYAK